jgi:hypothetical protein
MQPGTFDATILEFAKKEFRAAVGGTEGGGAHDGWCVLVDGEAGLEAAGRHSQERL